jgi:hypothetical protein
LRNGLPRFVVFIICDEEDCGSGSGALDIVNKKKRKEKKIQRKRKMNE